MAQTRNPQVQTVLHFSEESCTSGFLPNLARRHARDRYRLIIGTLKPMAGWLKADVEAQCVQTFSCECRGRAEYPLGLLRLAAFLRREGVGVLHTHLFDSSVVGLMAGVLARTPVRVMTRHHSNYHTRIDKRWHVRLDRLCTAMAHCVVPVSAHTGEHMRVAEGAPAGKLRVVYNGIDFDGIRVSSPDAPLALRRELAPAGEFLLVHVGRLHPEKGYEHLFRAMREVRARAGRPVRLVVAGEGPMRGRYAAMLRELGLDGAVTLLGFRRDVPDLIAAADALVLASVAESFGYVLAEALYLGTPVLATRCGGIPEVVDDGVDGLLVDPGSAEALADGIMRLARDQELLGRLAGQGRCKVIDKFSLDRMLRAYEGLYEEVRRGTPAGVPRGDLTAPGGAVRRT